MKLDALFHSAVYQVMVVLITATIMWFNEGAKFLVVLVSVIITTILGDAILKALSGKPVL